MITLSSMHPLIQQVYQTIERSSLLVPSERVLVALSGGADSVALLIILRELGYEIEAAHCNFHLREEASNADEAFVQHLCKRLNIPLHVRHFNTINYASSQGISIEMAARHLRYDWFASFRCPVATGHHREDNAETLLLNLCRGTGLKGLAGMRYRHGSIVRPLLDLNRTNIETFLAERNQDFCIDATNTDVRFRRNKIRHEVLPLLQDFNPNIITTLHETALRLREAEKIYLHGLDFLRQTLTSPLPDGFCIALNALLNAPSPPTLLHEWLSPLGFHNPVQLLDAREGTLIEGDDYLATRTQHTIEVRHTPHPNLNMESLHCKNLLRSELSQIPTSSDIACIDTGKIVGTLHLRSPQTGDRFSPFGMQGTKLVSDFLTDLHLSRIDKLHVRLLCDDQGILWIVGLRLAQRAALTTTTQHVTLITLPSHT